MCLLRSVTPLYFRTLGIPLQAGRGFADSDTAQAPPVILVNHTLARLFWSGASPLGGRLVIDAHARVTRSGPRGALGPRLTRAFFEITSASMTTVMRRTFMGPEASLSWPKNGGCYHSPGPRVSVDQRKSSPHAVRQGPVG